MSWEKTTQLSARKRKVEAELSFLAAVIPWSCSHRCSHHGKVDLPAPIIYSLALVEKRKGAIRKGATERCLKHLYLFFFLSKCHSSHLCAKTVFLHCIFN